MDILHYLAGSGCFWVSSAGSRGVFSSENAPADAPERCLDGCRHAEFCPYYAPKIYKAFNPGWPVSVITDDITPKGVERALLNGIYGRCVYACDNNMTEHQDLCLKFSNGVTAVFTMSAFTWDTSRTIKVTGENGEILGHMEKGEIELRTFSDQKAVLTNVNTEASVLGHQGGDEGLIKDFIDHLRRPGEVPVKTPLDSALAGHIMAFAAEASMTSGRTIYLEEFVQQYGQC